ncbi:TIGR04211 family SH3 domain-containing protein [Marinomonas sp.]
MPIKHVTSLIAGVILSATAHSATVYVSDIQFVAIREGQSNSTRAVERGLKSGTPLEVLERSDSHTKVRTPDGNEGWVADYFLSETAVTRDQVVSLQAQLANATESKINAQNELNDSQSKVQELMQTISTLEDDNTSLKERLVESKAITEKAQTIVSQNDNIAYQLESLKTQTQVAQDTMLALQKSTDQKWFMLGAATLFGGFLIGILLPLTRRKKVNNSSWG